MTTIKAFPTTKSVADGDSVRETASLLTLRALGLVFNGLLTLYLGLMLPDEAFGRYAFFTGFLTLTYMCCEFGLFLAAGRIAAFASPDGVRQLCGALVVLSVPLYLFYLAFVVVAAITANHFDKLYFEASLIPAILLSPGVLIHYGLTELCMGAGRLRLLGMLRFLPYAFALAAVGLLKACGALTYSRAAIVFAASFQLTACIGLCALRPRFDNLGPMFARLSGQKRFGFNVYLSRLVAVGIYNFDVPLVGYLLDFRQLAQYTMARTIAMPLALVGQTFSTTRYQQYSRAEAIPARQQQMIHVLAILAAIAPLTLGFGLVRWMFPGRPPEFYGMLQILAGSVFFRFTYPIYNIYLHANGHGDSLRNAALVSGLFNVLFYLVLIPTGGLYGVAATDALVCGIYYVHQLWLYRRTVLTGRQVRAAEEAAATQAEESFRMAA